MSQLIVNPYHSPREAREKGAVHVLNAAAKVNEALDEGQRVFAIAIGIVDQVAHFLGSTEEGWETDIRRHPESPDNLAILVVRGPQDWRPAA